MAKERRQKEQGIWDRFRFWMSRNEKVIMVGLLIMIAPLFAFTGPVYDFFSHSADNAVFENLYGEPVTRGDVGRTQSLLRAVSALAPRAFAETYPLLPGRDINPLEFIAFREKARRLGLGVSDDELKDRIREAWRSNKAAAAAAQEVPQPPNATRQQSFQRYFQIQDLARQKEEELRKAGTFDSAEWVRDIAQQRVRPRDLEEMLRDVYLVGKLQNYVLDDVQLTPEDVYEKYRTEHQTRKLSWIEVKADDEGLKEKLSTVTEEELQRYYDDNVEKFRKEFGLRAEYLIVPLEHFKAEAEKNVGEEDYQKTYEENRNDYRRPVIRSDEATFTLRSAQDQETYDKEVFYLLEEVRDKVREKVISDKARRELQTAVSDLRPRLAGGDSPAQLVEEYPFLKLGKTEFATREQAEDVFGEAYTVGTVNGWFRKATGVRPGRRVALDVPEYAQTLADDKGRIFYTSVETRPAAIPRFQKIQGEVKEAYLLDQGTRALRRRLETISEEINSGEGEDINSVAAAGVEVELAGGEKVSVSTGALQTATSYAKRARFGGAIRVATTTEESENQQGDQGNGEAEEPEEIHPASAEILQVGFSIDGVGKTGVTCGGETKCYLVLLDGMVQPDSSDFETREASLRTQVLQEKREAYLNEWRLEFFREAFGHSGNAEETPEGEEVAQN